MQFFRFSALTLLLTAVGCFKTYQTEVPLKSDGTDGLLKGAHRVVLGYFEGDQDGHIRHELAERLLTLQHFDVQETAHDHPANEDRPSGTMQRDASQAAGATIDIFVGAEELASSYEYIPNPEGLAEVDARHPRNAPHLGQTFERRVSLRLEARLRVSDLQTGQILGLKKFAVMQEEAPVRKTIPASLLAADNAQLDGYFGRIASSALRSKAVEILVGQFVDTLARPTKVSVVLFGCSLDHGSEKALEYARAGDWAAAAAIYDALIDELGRRSPENVYKMRYNYGVAKALSGAWQDGLQEVQQALDGQDDAKMQATQQVLQARAQRSDW